MFHTKSINEQHQNTPQTINVGHDAMAFSTLFMAFAFLTGTWTWFTHVQSFGPTIVSHGIGVWLALFRLARGFHLLIGLGAILDDYVHDIYCIGFLKLCVVRRIVFATTSCFIGAVRYGYTWEGCRDLVVTYLK
jgi:succinate dehydrogenase hydrophobic anchor subunit